ncbi:NAD(P)H-dependent oxidoreductase [Tellurirhabdus bombi]|uniref:NAD(P)H-dependent oxidoreductase n=1 Tax=Tellurirhabdus bombi TaxID=2907205 RepID=UPI001F455A28|nr:NAD(P)H-dependent oxidoreductase [Tellurirhabdus bombi]
MKIAIISTSPRQHSNSLRVARYIRNVLESYSQSDISLVNFEAYDIPLVGQSRVNRDELTPFQQELVEAWREADLIFFTVPEYNWTTSPQLINTFHQLGNEPFADLFSGKVFAIAGVSTLRGGRQPALQVTTILNEIVSYMMLYSVVSPRIWESHETDQFLNEAGTPHGNKSYDQQGRAFVDYALNMTQRWLAPNLE